MYPHSSYIQDTSFSTFSTTQLLRNGESYAVSRRFIYHVYTTIKEYVQGRADLPATRPERHPAQGQTAQPSLPGGLSRTKPLRLISSSVGTRKDYSAMSAWCVARCRVGWPSSISTARLGYPAFAAAFPDLTHTFTVATGSGVGRHVYLLAKKMPPTTRALDTPLGHIELRSSGTYVVAPPSIHPDTNQPYTVEKPLDILRVADLRDVVDWIEAFKSPAGEQPQWQPPRNTPPNGRALNPRLIEAVAKVLLWRRFKQRGDWLHGSCIYPERHKHGDRNPSFGFNTHSGYGHCYV